MFKTRELEAFDAYMRLGGVKMAAEDLETPETPISTNFRMRYILKFCSAQIITSEGRWGTIRGYFEPTPVTHF